MTAAVDQRLSESRDSPRVFYLSAADALRDAYRQLTEGDEDALWPLEEHLDSLPDKVALPIMSMVTDAQALLDVQRERVVSLLEAALALLGERP